jgi:hypothetical protein
MGNIFLRIFAVLLVLAAVAVGFVLWRTDPVIMTFKERALDTLETALVVRHPQTRQDVFGRIEKKGDVDYFTFTLARGTPVRFAIKTPAADRAFNPGLTLFGPGLPVPSVTPDVPVGEKNGAIVARVAGDGRTAVFQMSDVTTWYVGPAVDMVAPQDGTYALAITSPDETLGRYLLEIGGTPDRSADAIASFAAGTVRAILRLY